MKKHGFVKSRVTHLVRHSSHILKKLVRIKHAIKEKSQEGKEEGEEKRKAEEARKRAAEKKRKLAAERKRRAEEARLKAIAQKKAEEELRKKKEAAEKERREAEERKKRAAEEARLKAIAKKKAEEELRKKKAAEKKRKEEEAKQRAEEERKRKAEEARRAEARRKYRERVRKLKAKLAKQASRFGLDVRLFQQAKYDKKMMARRNSAQWKHYELRLVREWARLIANIKPYNQKVARVGIMEEFARKKDKYRLRMSLLQLRNYLARFWGPRAKYISYGLLRKISYVRNYFVMNRKAGGFFRFVMDMQRE